MSKGKTIKLDNGLTIILFNDNKKNRTVGTIFVNAGGRDTHYIYDGIEFNQVNGIAHFIEHYLLEKSKYGNIMGYFDNEYIGANGGTGQNDTEFYITTVHDFEDNFIKLINVVNDPRFDENDIEDVKKPIIAEISRSDDNPYQDYNRFVNKALYKNIKYNINLGTKEDITNLTIDDIKTFYDAFYQPSNQVILISGRFDEKKLIKLIEDEYKKLERDYKENIRDDIKEPVKVIKDKDTYIDKDKDEVVEIMYKVDVSSFSPEEKYKLSNYMSYVLKNNFSEKTPIFEKIREQELSPYSAGYGYDVLLDNSLFLIHFSLTTTKHDEAIKLFEDTFADLKYDEKSFRLGKNRVLLSIINNSENIHSVANKYYSVLDTFDYELDDEISLIDKLNLNECKEYIGRLDFSNKCIIKRIKGE